MTHECVLRCLSCETKALIIVNEFETQKTPLFQLRQVFAEIVVGDEERKVVVDLIESSLTSSGYPREHVEMFLGRLLMPADQASAGRLVRTGTDLRRPCSKPFEDAPQALAPQRPPSASRLAAIPRPGSTSRLPAQRPASSTRLMLGGNAKTMPSATIPVKPLERPPHESRNTLYLSHESVMGAPRKPAILVADDDKRSRVIAKVRLEEAGFLVVEAINGIEAWQKISENRYGFVLVVLDMKMPGMHGLEILAHMAEKQVQIPVIVCSAYREFKGDPVVTSNARLRYLTKPIQTEDLIASVKDLLGIA